MKKIALILFFAAFFFCPFKVDAASIRVAGTTATGVVGGNVTVNVTISEAKGLGSWEYSLSYDTDKLQLLSGSLHVVEAVASMGETSKTYTYTFRVKAAGTAEIKVINTAIAAWDETVTSPTDSTTIELVNQTTVTETYSTDNNLASLEVEGYELDKTFEKNITDYVVNVDSDVTKVNIKATANDKEAKISGTGEVEVHEGSNLFEITVTSQSGAVKTYKLTVNVAEKDPINVKVDGEEFTVVRNSDEVTSLIKDYYQETTTTINDEEVLAYEIEALDLTLVALKDEKGNIQFYIYEGESYSLYQELSGGSITIHLLDDKTKIPKRYQVYEEEIDGKVFKVYKLNKNSKYYLVYGENVETSSKGLYLYDSIDKTLQRYYTEEVESLEKDLQVGLYLIIGLIALIVIIVIIFLIVLHTKNKPKKNNKKEIKKRLKQEKLEFYS